MKERLAIGLIGSACLVAACGHSTPAPKAPVVDNTKPALAHEGAKACTASSGSKGAKPLGTPRASSTVALVQSGTRTIAYIADEDAKAIQTIDVDTKAELASTPLDGVPASLMVMPDGRVLVAIKNQARVEVLEASDKPESGLTMRCGADTPNEPLAMALTPDDKTVLVATGWGHTLGVYSADLLVKKSEIVLNREPRAVVASDDGKTAWVAHAVGSTISAVDLEKNTKKEISVRGRDPSFAMSMRMQKQSMAQMKKAGSLSPEQEKRFQESFDKQMAQMTRPAVQGYALAKSIDPPGRVLAPQVFVDAGDPTQRAEGYGHDSSPTESQDVAVIDEGTQQPFDASLNFARDRFFSGGDDPRDHHGACLLPRAAAVDTKSKTLLVTCFGLDEMISYDAAAANPSLAEKRRWRVGGGPSGVAVDPAKHRAVVWSQFDRAISVVSLEGRDVTDERKFPPAEVVHFTLAPMKEPLPADYQLGRLLFHNANDSRIARDGRACASCHPDGRDDSITWATPNGPRRSILLAGRVSATNRFSWSGTEKTLHEHLDVTFDRLSGQGVRSLERDAIVKYIKTLSPPNENVGVALDEKKVARGKELFASNETECASCHTPSSAFSDNQLHDVKSKTESDKSGSFNTPSLKGVGGAGPWFHDGRYTTMKDLLKASDGKMGKTKQLSDADLDALETYLRSI